MQNNEVARPDLMVFEPYKGGHRSEYVCHLLRAWQEKGYRGRLVVAVPEGLLDEQGDIANGLIEKGHVDLVTFEDLSSGGGGLAVLGKRNKRAFRFLVEEHRPKNVLATYFDHLQFGVSTGLRFDYDLCLSGILFRPTLHYKTPAFYMNGWFREWRKRVILRLSAANRHMKVLYTLDSTAVAKLQRLGFGKVIELPDPVGFEGPVQDVSMAKKRYAVGEDRKLWTFFGLLDSRKGIVQSLQALHYLEKSELAKISVLLLGEQAEAFREEIVLWILKAREKGVQVIVDNKRIPTEEIQGIIKASDLVMAPYQNHIGSSGVLLRAAAAGRPVLSQSYGLMGHNVRTHRLGLAVDTTNPQEIALAMRMFLNDRWAGFDKNCATQFAMANTPEAFTSVLLENMGLVA
jgi:glycosyltransferase involved in cell wall biosynthesis